MRETFPKPLSPFSIPFPYSQFPLVPERSVSVTPRAPRHRLSWSGDRLLRFKGTQAHQSQRIDLLQRFAGLLSQYPPQMGQDARSPCVEVRAGYLGTDGSVMVVPVRDSSEY
jgi:hypothetical protein